MHLQAGADVNLQNNLGDTPLHKAAYAGRKVRIKRGKSSASLQVCKSTVNCGVPSSSNLMSAGSAVTETHNIFSHLPLKLLSEIWWSDFFFNPPTPTLWTLKAIVLLLLRYDACANIINGTAQIPKDVTEDDEIITMLEGMKSWERFSFFFKNFFKCLMASHYWRSAAFVLKYWFGLCSCREESGKAAWGEASGSSQRGGYIHSV